MWCISSLSSEKINEKLNYLGTSIILFFVYVTISMYHK